MYPAYSVIFFTVSSGAGYGLLIWLTASWQLDLVHLSPRGASVIALAALVLVTAGLLSSTFHLGHPERAWRAISQWRTSWLSREGVLALLTYLPALALMALWWLGHPGGFVDVLAVVTLLLSLVTVYSTAMIYASLETIPRWANPWVPPVYVGFALASGGLLWVAALTLSRADQGSTLLPVLVALVMGWVLKVFYWRYIDGMAAVSHSGSATGLSSSANVRALDLPHTSTNFVMAEMGYKMARKHATRLRRLALLLGVGVPGICLPLIGPAPIWLQGPLVLLALTGGLMGVLIERWLFFAEAQHLVTLFYGATQV